MVGGRAERFGRGVKSIKKTKGLLELPYLDGTETLIDRTIRLLKEIDKGFDIENILMCVGYKEELLKEKYDCKFLTTYDPKNPTDVLPAFLEVINEYDKERFIFIMDNTVWSSEALEHFFQYRGSAPMVLYHGKDPNYCEVFGMIINNEEGKDIIRQANAVKSMPVVPGEIRWKLQNITDIEPKDCRTSCMEQWIDNSWISGKLRVYQKGFVDDIDWDFDHKRICEQIRNKEFV